MQQHDEVELSALGMGIIILSFSHLYVFDGVVLRMPLVFLLHALRYDNNFPCNEYA